MASNLPWPHAHWCGRAFWLALAVVHLVPLATILSRFVESPQWGLATKAIVLLLTLAFFGAKAAGVRFMPSASRRTAAILFLVACGLAHRGVRDDLAVIPVPVVLVVVAMTVATPVFLRRRGRHRFLGEGPQVVAELLRLAAWGRLVGRLLPARMAVALASNAPRGPPSF